jgi:hypothetical protein
MTVKYKETDLKSKYTFIDSTVGNFRWSKQKEWSKEVE